MSIQKGKSAQLTNVSSYFFSQRYFVVPDSVQDLSPHSPEIPEKKKMPLNAKLFNTCQNCLGATNEAFTEIVFHTNVEAGIRGVIGLLIVLRPGSIKLVLTLRQHWQYGMTNP